MIRFGGGGRRRGSTLILVIVFGALMAGVVIATAGIAKSGLTDSARERQDSDLTYRLDAAADILRLQLLRSWETSGLTPEGWLDGVIRREGADGDVPARPRTTAAVPGGPADPLGSPRTFVAFPDVQAWIEEVGPRGQSYLEIVAQTAANVGAGLDSRRGQSVRIRVSFGQPELFKLAMLTVTTNCMFCHMRIKGDVGSIGYYRPGWGRPPGHPDRESGNNSGANSFIAGSLYTAADTIDMNGVNGLNGDQADQASWTVNVAGQSIPGTLHKGYDGNMLPDDRIGNDGIPDFPTIDPVAARNSAKGTVWAGNPGGGASVGGGGVWVIPMGGNFSSAVTPNQTSFQSGALGNGANGEPLVNATGSVVNGNLVLVGTETHPIQINGDVFVEGDVIIKGPIKGKGAIYSGRNTYIAGDLTYTADSRPAGWTTAGGSAGSTGPLGNDAGAISSLANDGASASEVRIAARNNIVVGDYTYANSDSTPQQMKYRQGQDFMQAQFSLGQTRYYDTQDGSSELVAKDTNNDGVPDQFFNDQGIQVTDPDRIAKAESGANMFGDASPFDRNVFDSAMAPGQVTRDGAGNAVHQSWIGQDQYREILGTKEYDGMVWRFNVPAAASSVQAAELGPVPTNSGPNASGWTYSNNWNALPNDNAWFEKDKHGAGKGQLVHKQNVDPVNGVTMRGFRVLETGTKSWPTQVSKIDAFLYANKRIAGVTLGDGLTINGGMAAQEIGVLAPGVRDGNTWWKHVNRIPSANTHKANYVNPFGSVGAEDPRARLFLNYDFRLRNGGYGFNLVEGEIGELKLYRRAPAHHTPPS